MITPVQKYLLAWNIFMSLIYLLSIIIDSLIIGFDLRILVLPKLNVMQSIFSFLMMVDIALKFFVALEASTTDLNQGEEEEDVEEEALSKATAKVAQAVPEDEEDDAGLTRKQRQELEWNRRIAKLAAQKEERRQLRRTKEIEKRNAVWYDPNFDKRFSRISKKYLGNLIFGYFLFDVIACVPVFLYEMLHGFVIDKEKKLEQVSHGLYYAFFMLKLFKLMMLPRILA